MPQPITGLPRVITVLPLAPGLAVVGTGVQMPSTQLALLKRPVVDVVDEQPVSRAGSESEGSAFLPSEVPKAPAVPVYPRKQARH